MHVVLLQSAGNWIMEHIGFAGKIFSIFAKPEKFNLILNSEADMLSYESCYEKVLEYASLSGISSVFLNTRGYLVDNEIFDTEKMVY